MVQINTSMPQFSGDSLSIAAQSAGFNDSGRLVARPGMPAPCLRAWPVLGPGFQASLDSVGGEGIDQNKANKGVEL